MPGVSIAHLHRDSIHAMIIQPMSYDYPSHNVCRYMLRRTWELLTIEYMDIL